MTVIRSELSNFINFIIIIRLTLNIRINIIKNWKQINSSLCYLQIRMIDWILYTCDGVYTIFFIDYDIRKKKLTDDLQTLRLKEFISEESIC